MNARVFVDTNLLIYSISDDVNKASKIERLLQEPFSFVISTQVISEFAHTCYRKNLLSQTDIRSAVEDFLLFFDLATIGETTIKTAFDLKARHSFSWYDALIVAAALENGCETLYSEDMQHGLVIEKRLSIQNPFLALV
jgi:predicted nucleic acid-binding protein